MLSSGNSLPQQCAYNLVRTVAGECPMARAKGLKSDHIDSPANSSLQSVRGDIEELIKAYEPRVNLNRVSLSDLGIDIGDYQLNLTVEEGLDDY